MAFTPRTRLVNPRLGTYFGIFASAFAALVLLLLMFEQMGMSETMLRGLMFSAPILLYGAFGAASHTREPLEFFAAGRRVPAVYCGLGLAMTAMGASGFVGMAGLLFIAGFDALCVITGGVAGFVVMAILLAPFFRKFGAYTVPSYLGRRFHSRPLRITAAALLCLPTLLVLIAELSVGAMAAAWLTGQETEWMIAILVLALIIMLSLGGMRAVTWTNVATSIAALLGIVVPIAILAVMLGYLPLPQLSGGPVLRAVGQAERLQSLPIMVPHLFEFRMPDMGMQPVIKAFARPFGSIGAGSYIVATLTVMAGIAAAPWVLPRVATAPGVYEARKSLGWATLFFGLAMLTIATIAIFMRYYLAEVADSRLASMPQWFNTLVELNLAEATTRATRVAVTSVAFERDMILISLPIAGGLPMVFAYFAAAAIVAAALAAASATSVALGNMLSEDIFYGWKWEPKNSASRLMTARAMLALGLVSAGLVAATGIFDPVRIVFWALVLTGSTAFPVLVASIWWKRMNAYGAFAGMCTGAGVAVIVIALFKLGLIELHAVMASLIAMPMGLVAAIVVSLMTPRPSKQVLELVRDIRVPGGEILYDREMRLQRLKERNIA